MKVGDRVRIKHTLYPDRRATVVEYVKGLDWPWFVEVEGLAPSGPEFSEHVYFSADELAVIE